MDIKEFEKKIIPACRTKHLYITNSPSEPKRLFRKSKTKANEQNKVPYFLKDPVIPKEFVRLDPWEMEYLFMVASRTKVGILETGRFNGGSVVVMSCANAQVPIYSIDIAPQNDTLLNETLKELKIGQNVKLITGDSQKTKYPEVGQVDLLYVDADHSYQGCLNDLTNWYDNLIVGGHVILHDCYFGSEVQDAVLDFIAGKPVEIVATPYKINQHHRYPEGSFCHFIKRG